MKRIVALLIALCAVAAMFTVLPAAEEPAILEPEDAWYQRNTDANIFFISTAEDLLGLAELTQRNIDFAGKTIELTADIDLNPGWNAKAAVDATRKVTLPTAPANVFQGLKSFSGVLDGRGHTISGVYMMRDMSVDNFSTSFGFIWNLNGQKDECGVRNLALVNSAFISMTIEGAMGTGIGVGSLVGRFTTPKNGCVTFIENVYVDADVIHYNQATTNKSLVGGILGRLDTTPTKPDMVVDGDGIVTFTKYYAVIRNAVFAGRVITPDGTDTANGTVLNTAQICGGGQRDGKYSTENPVSYNSIYLENCVAMGQILSKTEETYGEGKETCVNYLEGKYPAGTAVTEDIFLVSDHAGTRPAFKPDATFDAVLADQFAYSTEAGALIPSSVKDILDPNVPPMPNETDPAKINGEDDGGDDNPGDNSDDEIQIVTRDRSNNTTAPTENTEQPGENGGETEKPKKKGCGSTVAGLAAVILAVGIVPVTMLVRKKED